MTNLNYEGLDSFIAGYLLCSQGHLFDVLVSYNEVTIKHKEKTVAIIEIKNDYTDIELTKKAAEAVEYYL